MNATMSASSCGVSWMNPCAGPAGPSGSAGDEEEVGVVRHHVLERLRGGVVEVRCRLLHSPQLRDLERAHGLEVAGDVRMPVSALDTCSRLSGLSKTNS